MTSRWTALCDRRGGGGLVQVKKDMRTNATNGGGGRVEGEMKRYRKLIDIGGAGGLE